jgi:RHH-type transcriptional regulator, proline utilization regulon repressor / proline dehydrogenase / delta 1-pyrroline-5-carboxylate dehydrogenase
MGAASPIGQEQELPGPVGERNFYTVLPRGSILLRPLSRAGLFHQLAAVLATGNDATFESDVGLVALLADLPTTVRQRIRMGGNVDGALVEGMPDEIVAAASALASRRGPIVSVHAAASGEMTSIGAYCLDWLVREVSTSINTTAAGGNAHLLTQV